MNIIFDYDFDSAGRQAASHLIETTPGKYLKVQVPALGHDPVDVIQFINALHKGTIPIAGTGWEEVTKHPDYPNQTRLDALIGEIVRLDDRPSRAILGV